MAPGFPLALLLLPTSLSPMQLIEDLRKELEHLQMYKLDYERPGRGRGSSSGLGEFSARAREVELEHEVKRLKQVGPGSLCLAESDGQLPTGGTTAETYSTTFPHVLLSALSWLSGLLIPISAQAG